MNLYARIQDNDLLKYLSAEQADDLMKIAAIETHPRGTELIKSGSRQRDILVILAGEVELYDFDREGGKVIIDRCGENEMIGEICFSIPIRQPFTALALSAVRIARFPVKTLHESLAGQPDTAARVLAAINDALCLKNTRMTQSLIR